MSPWQLRYSAKHVDELTASLLGLSIQNA